MNIIPSFSLYKCNKCDKNGFIVNDGLAIKCNCRFSYEQELRTCDSLVHSGLLNENSTYEDFKKLIDFDWSDYRGKDENENMKKLRKYVDNFDKVKYKEVPHNSVDDKGNIIRTEYSKVSIENPFKHLHGYIFGKQGTQKTYTMKGLLTKLACNNKKVCYIFAKDLIGLIMDSERNENSRIKLDYVLHCDVLAVDEFDANRICLWQSGYKEKSLIVWLKTRLEVIKKSTWFISNFTIQELKDSPLGELYGDLIDRETMYARFEFKDKYVDNLSDNEIKNKISFLWND